MNTTTLPSIKQMVNRANEGHLRVLRAWRDQTSLDAPGLPLSSLRGYMTCGRTLVSWGCIDGETVTERGHELIAALEQKWHLS